MLYFWKKAAGDRAVCVSEFNGVDPSVGMLEVAKEKIDFANFQEGTATTLPFEDNSMDFISISYGIRNVVQREDAWGEFYRVLKPNGQLVILEFTKPEKENFMGSFVKWYMKKAIPFIGSLISKHNDAYSYLPDSIDAFSTTKNLRDEMIKSGFKECFIRSYSFEISTLFIMRKV
jgi:demethylmenaquinone methyltransferase/2-methoxy-6-polyprenyl-1,4-benzoquinol methylase